MYKKFQNAYSLILAICFLLLLLPCKTYGETVAPSYVVDSFLFNLQNQLFSDAYSQIYDERTNINSMSPIDYDKSGLKSFISLYAKNPIQNYQILYSNNDTIFTEIHFVSGDICVIPFKVVLYNGTYKIYITSDDANITKIYDSAMTPILTVSKNLYSNPVETLLDTYSFSYLFGNIYGLHSFNLTNNTVKINGYQRVDDASASCYDTPTVCYSIVQQNWYGDNIWAQSDKLYLKGNFTIVLTGKSRTFNNAVIRIENCTGAYPRSAGNGRIYQIQ